MPKCKILEHWPNASNWQVGDVVDITNPFKLIEEGKVELYKEPAKKTVKKAEETTKKSSSKKKK